MEILGRETYSVDISPIAPNSMRIGVRHKDGDCKKKIEPSYVCTGNCNGLFMFTDCMFPDQDTSGKPYVWANALTKKRNYISPYLFSFYGVENFDHVEKLFEQLMKDGNEFNLEIIRKPGDIIYPCTDGVS